MIATRPVIPGMTLLSQLFIELLVEKIILTFPPYLQKGRTVFVFVLSVGVWAIM